MTRAEFEALIDAHGIACQTEAREQTRGSILAADATRAALLAAFPASAPPEASGLREALAYARDVAEKCALDHGHDDEAGDCGHDSFESCVTNLAAVLRRAALAATPDARPDPTRTLALPPTCPTCGAFVFSDPDGTAHCGCAPASPQATTPAPSAAPARETPPRDPSRCTVCGSRRIPMDRAGTIFGACGLVPGRDGTGGCPDPLHDYNAEQAASPPSDAGTETGRAAPATHDAKDGEP